MFNGVFNIPKPANELGLTYAPSSPERLELKAKLKEMLDQQFDVPMIIGGEEVRNGKLAKMRCPHDHQQGIALPQGWEVLGEPGVLAGALAAARQVDEVDRCLCAALGLEQLLDPFQARLGDFDRGEVLFGELQVVKGDTRYRSKQG